LQTNRSMPVFKFICYLLAGATLVLGLAAGFSLIASAGNVRNFLLPFQFPGAEVVVNLIAPFLTNLIAGFGVFVLIISLLLSLLLFVAGLLLGTIASLEERLARLEAQSFLKRGPADDLRA
jgi:hypothetical protein